MGSENHAANLRFARTMTVLFLIRSISWEITDLLSRDIHLYTHPTVLHGCGAGSRCRWTQFLSIGTPWMPHNAFWGRSAGQVNVTRAGFAVSYFVSHTCWQPLPQRVNSVNANDSTAAGIKRLRRLKFKRCVELASRLSSRLTFACLFVAVCVNY